MKRGDRVKCQVTSGNPIGKPCFGHILEVLPGHAIDGRDLVKVKVTIKSNGKPYSRPQYSTYHENFITVLE